MGELQLVPTRIFAHRCLDEKRVVAAVLNEGVIHHAKVAGREPFKHVFEWVHLMQLALELSGGVAVRLERLVSAANAVKERPPAAQLFEDARSPCDRAPQMSFLEDHFDEIRLAL